ncbi:MAG TPA: DNA polymerase III subunit gamma/tau [Armatimonadaceae bacterium]|nr:DNA polymerase III subunit gamma/tau [Armatimonadaceae bacterium]
MAYQSLYRKYRPQTFADVMGQGHVTRTLQNALASGRVAHGYLFTGTRGTAKTTVARLLAKALNCESGDGPVSEPCNRCEACASITAGTCIDVIEMDAASHRGVADIEEVRKAVGYGPMQFRYKVFIIDEAHQLSSDAKDAFLKTLEEPPSNVVFILATTEPQAIPITIRSRCQQFDFKRGSLQEITTRLRFVLDAEGVTYDPEAITLVARGAEGSYRDSLSLLEQVLAFAPTHVGAADVDTVLGTLDTEMLSRVTDAVSRRDAAEAFALAGQLLDAGKEARTLLRTLSLHVRDLLLVSVGGPAAGAEFTPEEAVRLQEEARRFTPSQMMRAMDVLNEAQGETRWNNQHRLLVELTFLKMMNLGEGQGSGQTFATAPIVFSAAQPSSLPAPPAAAAGPATVSPAPTPPAQSAPARTPKVKPDVPAVVATEDAPAEAAASPSSAAKNGSDSSAAPAVANAAVAPTDEAPTELPAGFFADDRAGSDDEDDYTPLDDNDAPAPTEDELESGALFSDVVEEPVPTANPPLSVVASVPARAAAPPSLLAFEGQDGGADEDGLPPVVPQEGPSLFDVAADDEPDDRAAEQPASAAAAPASPPAPEVAPEPAPPPVVAASIPEPPPAPTPAPVSEPEPEVPVVSLREVQGVWHRFLQEAARISKRTSILMETAMPTGIEGKVVVIQMRSRPNYEMITGNPKGREFVEKLLARCLQREGVRVRFELDPTVATPPNRAASPTEARRHDPIAAIDTLDMGRVEFPPLSSDIGGGDPFGGNDFGVAPAVRSVPAVAPPERPGGGLNGGQRAASPSQTPTSEAWPPPHQVEPWGGGDASARQPRGEAIEKALEDPLIQEVLSIFGGEIVE